MTTTITFFPISDDLESISNEIDKDLYLLLKASNVTNSKFERSNVFHQLCFPYVTDTSKIITILQDGSYEIIDKINLLVELNITFEIKEVIDEKTDVNDKKYMQFTTQITNDFCKYSHTSRIPLDSTFYTHKHIFQLNEGESIFSLFIQYNEFDIIQIDTSKSFLKFTEIKSSINEVRDTSYWKIYSQNQSNPSFELLKEYPRIVRSILLFAGYRFVKQFNHKLIGIVAVPKKYLTIEDIQNNVNENIQYIMSYGLRLTNIRYPSKLKPLLSRAMNSPTNRCILIPIALYNVTTDTIFHANLIIINKYLKTIEYFEPYGSNMTDLFNYIVDYNKIKEKLIEMYPLLVDYTFLSPDESCSKFSFQTFSENLEELTNNDFKGYCGYWSIFWAEMRIQYYKIPSKQLQNEIVGDLTDQLFDDDKNPFLQLIRNYTYHILTKGFEDILKNDSFYEDMLSQDDLEFLTSNT